MRCGLKIRWFVRILATLFFIALPASNALATGLFDLYSRALERDPAYLAARAQYDSDALARDLAGGAFLPSVNLSASYGKTYNKRGDQNFNPSQDAVFDPAVVSLRLTQPLYSKDRQAFRRENLARADRAEWALAQAKQDLAQRLVEASYNYLLTLDQITLTQAQAKALEGQVTQLESLLASRSSTRTEVADARARFELAKGQIAAALSQLEVRKLEFIRLIGTPPPASLQPLANSPPPQSPEPADPQAWIDAARERSYRVRTQRGTVEQADAAIDRIKAGFFPSVSLDAGLTQSTNPNFFTTREQTASINLQLNWNLYDGGSTRVQTAQAVAQAQRARHELDQVQHEVAISTGQAYWGVVNGILQVQATEKAVSAAELALDGTRLGIKANIRTYIDELNAVQLLFTTRRDLQRERYNYLVNRSQLLWSAGLADEALASLLSSMLAP